MTTPMHEVIEGYAETTKDLLRKWSDYGQRVAPTLQKYDAKQASADMGEGVLLAIETGARLTWEAVDAMTTLTSAPSRPRIVISEEFDSPLDGATLTLKGDLENRAGNKLLAGNVAIDPEQLEAGKVKFNLRANVAGCPAGIYRGMVEASAGGEPKEVKVRIKVP
jgi:hypothetical protein